MTFYPTDRIALFIDGSNLHSAAKNLGFDVDYRKLLEEFRKRGVLIRAYYYTALVEDEDYSPIRPLVDWLDYNGYSLVTKTARQYTDSQGRKRWRGDMDVEIAVDMMEMSTSADHMVLFSGDGDFRTLVAAVQRRGARVTVVSTLKSQPPMASDDLRRQADEFVELADLADIIGRPARLPRFIQESRAARENADESEADADA
ncbi:MAG TPA: NYN domain-containing protein [Phenylobacterium sp.]|nr:NYN domain-containing protein [Phenylobacterium sp.]